MNTRALGVSSVTPITSGTFEVIALVRTINVLKTALSVSNVNCGFLKFNPIALWFYCGDVHIWKQGCQYAQR